MKRTERIIIDAEPQDVSKALIEKESISNDYELKEFTYTLSEIKKDFAPRDFKEFKITHCRLVLEKK